MIDYKLRSSIRDSSLYLFYVKYKRIEYLFLTNVNVSTYEDFYNYDFVPYEMFEDFQDRYDKLLLNYSFELDLCEKIFNAERQRKQRLFRKIKSLLNSGNCLFCTFTFTNNVLGSTNAESRRKYVRRFCNEYANGYVANIDFGFDNEREHYHGLLQTDFINAKNWNYGNFDFEKVVNKDAKRLGLYINKITNHGIKNTACRSSIIYDRKNSGKLIEVNTWRDKCYIDSIF